MRSRIDELIQRHRLPDSYRQAVATIIAPLARHLAGWITERDHPPLIGINGCQGAGKTTLVRFLSAVLETEHGLRCATLSIDDIYHTRTTRERLADTVHPLLVTRGVPGTHDLALGHAVLDALGRGARVALPQFDKSADDRRAESEWVRVDHAVDLAFFDGWCMACPPQPAGALQAPVNELEAREDPDGSWRRFVNEQLEGPYRALFARLDYLVMLEAPGFECVFDWRWRQEQELQAAAGPVRLPGMMDPTALRRFLQHYERLTRHMLAVLPSRADVLIPLSTDHAMRKLKLKTGK